MMHDREEQEKEEQYFARQLEHFRKRWAAIILGTDGPRAVSEFETDLYYLLNKAQRVAQAPLVKQMSAAMALVPPGPIIFEKPKESN